MTAVFDEIKMKIIRNLSELKKNDTIIIKNNKSFLILGYQKIIGTVFLIKDDNKKFSIKCKETGFIENIEFGDGDVFLL